MQSILAADAPAAVAVAAAAAADGDDDDDDDFNDDYDDDHDQDVNDEDDNYYDYDDDADDDYDDNDVDVAAAETNSNDSNNNTNSCDADENDDAAADFFLYQMSKSFYQYLKKILNICYWDNLCIKYSISFFGHLSFVWWMARTTNQQMWLFFTSKSHTLSVVFTAVVIIHEVLFCVYIRT